MLIYMVPEFPLLLSHCSQLHPESQGGEDMTLAKWLSDPTHHLSDFRLSFENRLSVNG